MEKQKNLLLELLSTLMKDKEIARLSKIGDRESLSSALKLSY
jgi:hypothetical protein